MSRGRRAFDAFFRDKSGRVVLAQRPNLPLVVWAAAWLLQWPLHGQARHVAGLVGSAALLVWAALELGWGASYFRRALGLAVLVYLAASRLM